MNFRELSEEREEGWLGTSDDGLDELGSDSFGLNTGIKEVFQEVVDFFGVASRVGFEKLGKGLCLGEAEGLFEEGGGDGLVGESGDLVEDTERITEGAAAAADNDIEGAVFDGDFFGVSDFTEVLFHSFGVGKAESVDLGAGGNGNRDFVGVSGRHDENDVLGRFFESFQKGVGGGFSQHMDLVDNVYLVFPFCRGDDGFFAELADIVDAGVGGGVDFDDVEITVFELVVEIVDSVSKNPGNGGFTGATRADEEIGVGDFTLFERAF